MRPRGIPPTPSARSSAIDPVGDQLLARPELHDRAATELLLDRGEGGVDRLATFGGIPFGRSFFRHRHLSVTLLIRSCWDRSPERTTMTSAGRSAFFRRLVLDDRPLLARLADHLDVLGWLRQRRHARLCGLLLWLLLLFARSVSRAHRFASASSRTLPI